MDLPLVNRETLSSSMNLNVFQFFFINMAYSLEMSFQYSLSELPVHFILEAGFVVVCSLFAPITLYACTG